jgi:glycosyltransferase involved in cell wall biosynthesis
MSQSNDDPLVSVVMSVYNGAALLERTMDSLLAQRGCDFEIVVIDDGSADTTPSLLAEYAQRDARVRVIRQQNTGLTRALIHGCELARGRFIARQDADDLSLPGRLKEQSDYLVANPDVVAVAGTARFVAPDGEWMYDVVPASRIAIELDVDHIKTPPLFATMFRRDVYLQCGGFRPQFVVAQDVDLWLRLEEAGLLHGLPRLHYQARMAIGGISSRRRLEQYRIGSLAIECAKRRRRGESDQPLLDAFDARSASRKPMTRAERARFNYYVGACLRRHDPPAARRYYARALRDNPFHLKALLRYLIER